MTKDFLSGKFEQIDNELLGKWQLLGVADNLYSDTQANDKLDEISKLSINENEFCENCNIFGCNGKTKFQLGNMPYRLECEYIVAKDNSIEYLKQDRLYVFITNFNIENAVFDIELPDNFDDYANNKKTRKNNLPIWLLECERNIGKILVYERKE